MICDPFWSFIDGQNYKSIDSSAEADARLPPFRGFYFTAWIWVLKFRRLSESKHLLLANIKPACWWFRGFQFSYFLFYFGVLSSCVTILLDTFAFCDYLLHLFFVFPSCVPPCASAVCYFVSFSRCFFMLLLSFLYDFSNETSLFVFFILPAWCFSGPFFLGLTNQVIFTSKNHQIKMHIFNDQ